MSQRSSWRRFVEGRRPGLHDVYPCSMPTRRRWCPRHRAPVGSFTAICESCRDELYERLAGEYTAALEDVG